jgi:hypothetical protein
VAEHDWGMPHDIRLPPDDLQACPPNCPYRLEREDDTGLSPEQVQTTWETAEPADDHTRTAAAGSRADAAWAELEALRVEADRLGLEDFRTDPLAILRERVVQANTALGES